MKTVPNKIIAAAFIIVVPSIILFSAIKLLNRNNTSPVSSTAPVPISEQLESLYSSYTVLDAVKVEVSSNTMTESHFLPDYTQEKAVIGPNPETQAARTLTLLDEQVWVVSKKDNVNSWYQPTAEELGNEDFLKDVHYSAALRLYDTGYTDDQKPYYAVEATVQTANEKAQPIIRHLLSIQPEGNTERLPYNEGYTQSHDKVDFFQDIRYFSYPEGKPENVNVNITLNLFCYTGFPWDLRDGYEKANGYILNDITLG